MSTTINFNSTTPSAPGGNINVAFQNDGSGNISAYIPVGGGATAAIGQISQQLLGSPAATVTFSSIPATYSNLWITMDAASSNAGVNDQVNIALNGTAGYAISRIYWNSSQQTNSNMIGLINAAGGPGSSSGRVEVQIFNYAGTTFIKRYRGVSGWHTGSNINSPGFEYIEGTMQSLTSAVTSVAFTLNSGSNFVTGSVFTLYGLL